jgi:hypothetical protein
MQQEPNPGLERIDIAKHEFLLTLHTQSANVPGSLLFFGISRPAVKQASSSFLFSFLTLNGVIKILVLEEFSCTYFFRTTIK